MLDPNSWWGSNRKQGVVVHFKFGNSMGRTDNDVGIWACSETSLIRIDLCIHESIHHFCHFWWITSITYTTIFFFKPLLSFVYPFVVCPVACLFVRMRSLSLQGRTSGFPCFHSAPPLCRCKRLLASSIYGYLNHWTGGWVLNHPKRDTPAQHAHSTEPNRAKGTYSVRLLPTT